MLLGISRWQLNKLVRDGAIECVWLNRRARRFRPAVVESYIDTLPTKKAA
jgi:predicted site-specific integrase-resolvase